MINENLEKPLDFSTKNTLLLMFSWIVNKKNMEFGMWLIYIFDRSIYHHLNKFTLTVNKTTVKNENDIKRKFEV